MAPDNTASTVIALAGNPNVGKSSIFNALTGSRQHVGNWPGKTVEKKEGVLRTAEADILVVDLPGTYSLTAYTIEEIIARDFIVNESPTAVVAVIDASNLERNLYLVTQLVELRVPVILVLNMSDIANSQGLKIHAEKLSKRLGGIPVIETVGNRRIGIEELKKAIQDVSRNPQAGLDETFYKGELQSEIQTLEGLISERQFETSGANPYWLAMKLLENDPSITASLESQGAEDLLKTAEEARQRIERKTGEEAETLIVDQRYEFIASVVSPVLERPREASLTSSDRIDKVVTHRIWGLPIFLLMMWIVFQFTASVSAPYLDWVDTFFNEVVYSWVYRLLAVIGLGGTWVQSLITDGLIAGVGGVLVFVPVLLFLYMALAVLEDTGYMARAAFVMDRVMRWMGLHGKSFLPMIVGFGCTVPAVYATRTLDNERDRKLTGFLATFMSCGARLPVYVVFGAAFFGAASGSLVFSMYLLGIAVALLVGFGFKHTVYRGMAPAPFVMELPPYRLPRAADVWRQMWERTRGFLIKASTIILLVSAVLWLLMAIPAPGAGSFDQVPPQDSLFGVVSGFIAPVFIPAGFGSWEAAGSLMTGFVAKEVVVGTMNQIYAVEEEPAISQQDSSVLGEIFQAALRFGKATLLTVQEIFNIIPRTINLIPFVDLGEFQFFGPDQELTSTTLENALVRSFSVTAGSVPAGLVAAVAFNVFVLLYVPCVAAVSAMRQEFGWRWMWAQILFTLGLAWTAAVLVFQVGTRIFI
jgi:ferrous iron transport protein B